MEIKIWTTKTFNVEFQMMAKTDVHGKYACETFKYLRWNSPLNTKKGGEVKEIPWNFTKFLLNE